MFQNVLHRIKIKVRTADTLFKIKLFFSLNTGGFTIPKLGPVMILFD